MKDFENTELSKTFTEKRDTLIQEVASLEDVKKNIEEQNSVLVKSSNIMENELNSWKDEAVKVSNELTILKEALASELKIAQKELSVITNKVAVEEDKLSPLRIERKDIVAELSVINILLENTKQSTVDILSSFSNFILELRNEIVKVKQVVSDVEVKADYIVNNINAREKQQDIREKELASLSVLLINRENAMNSINNKK